MVTVMKPDFAFYGYCDETDFAFYGYCDETRLRLPWLL